MYKEMSFYKINQNGLLTYIGHGSAETVWGLITLPNEKARKI